jgi:putative spermidine/putrescine transport system ATP-binding protein/spermidine/putrescine transport system ATP-binding protein
MLLLDDPLGALDKGLRESMQVELRGLQQRLGLTTVMVTHDQDEALTMADTIVVMRDGKLEQVGSAAEIYQRPATEFVANFIGASNMFNGHIERSSGEGLEVKTGSGIRLRVNGSAGASAKAIVSVRPEAIVIEHSNAGATQGDSFNTVRAQVDEIVYRGFVSHYYLRLPDGQQMVVFRQNQGIDRMPTYAKGDEVVARWDTSSNHLLSGA